MSEASVKEPFVPDLNPGEPNEVPVVSLHSEPGNALEAEPIRPEIEVPKQPDQQYPVTWLPAMVVTSDNPSPYLIEATADKIPPELMTPGTLIQLPQAFGANPASKFYGLVVGPNTVVPIDSLSLVNFPGFGKIPVQNTGSEGVELGDSGQGMVKIDSGEVTHQDVSYQNMSAEAGDKDPVFCIYCHKYLKTVNDLHNHMLLEHTEHTGMGFMGDGGMHPSLQTCPGCGHQLRKVGAYDSDYPSMSNTHEEEQSINLTQSSNILMICDHCCKEFTLALAPDTSHSGISDTPKRHFCDHCEKSYKHNRDLRKHMRTHHGIENSTHSLGSSYTSTSGQSASFQQETPTSNPKMVCNQCKKMFRGPFELRRHIHTVHENKRPYKCPECSKLFRDAYELKRHSASHQRVHFHAVVNSGVPPEGSSSLEMLRLQNAHQGDASAQMLSVGQLPSGGVLRDVYSMQTGTPINHPPPGVDYYCSTCEKNFRGANEFKRHYSVVHEKKYRYKCIHCGKLWRDQYDLKRHCRRSHFVDRDIDRGFIRQCLLDNNSESSVAVQQPMSLANFDMGPQVTLALNQEVATAIFGASEDIRNSTAQMDQFAMVDHNSLNNTAQMIQDITRTSPTSSMFQNLPSIQPASMLYHSAGDSAHLVENILPSQDSEAIKEESKNAVSWSNFESDIRASPK